jgi:hypothetical protein
MRLIVKTAVLMKRPLLGGMVSQNSKTEMLSLTELSKIGNKWRMANGLSPFVHTDWLKNKGTQEFISELEQRYGKGNVLKSGRGRGSHTWAHPLLFIDMALSISPQLKIEVYEWLFDHLIRERNSSGVSYSLMCGALYKRNSNYTKFPDYIQDVEKKIRLSCGVTDWQEATEAQLRKRDKLHNDIALLADVLNNNDEAVRLAILKTAEI